MVKNFYQPNPPVDWTKELSDIYARQTRQLEEHHANLRQRDQQMVAKAKAEDITKLFSGLASFSTSLKAAVDATKARSTKKKTTKVKQFLDKFPGIDLTELVTSYEGKREDLFKSSEFFNHLESNIPKGFEDNAPEFLETLRGFDPRERVILKETLARQYVQHKLPSEWSARKSQLTRDENYTVQQLAQAKRDFEGESLESFNVNEEFIATILSPELDRQKSTSKGSAAAAAQSSFNQNQRAKAKVIFGTNSGALNPTVLPQSLVDNIKLRIPQFKDIEGGLTAVQQATESVLNDFNELNENGYVPPLALTGLADYKFDHPAGGKDGQASILDAFFAKDGSHFNNLVAANNRGQSKYLAAQTGIDQEVYNKAVALAQQGKTAEADELMRPLIGRDLLSQEQFADYERINPVEQSKPYEVSRDEYYTDLDLRGKLPSIEELNLESNKAMKDKWLAIKRSKEKWKTDNAASYNPDLFFKNEAYSIRTKESLLAGQPITADDGRVVQKLKDFSDMRLSYYLAQDRKNGTETPNIAALIKNDVDAFKVANGWGTQNEAGMFSLDTTDIGNPKWANINKVDLDLGYGVYNHNKPSATREQDYNRMLRNHPDKTKEERHKISGTIFSNRQMLGFKENLYFSEDMKYIAAREGLTLAEAFDLSLKSMDPKFAKLHNFEELKEEKAVKAQRQLSDGLDKAFKEAPAGARKKLIRDLRYKLKWQGWDSFTPKDQAILINIISDFNPQTNDIKEEADLDNRELIASDALTALEDK